jgi:DEAD/DEAH box helicase domain-containing protein
MEESLLVKTILDGPGPSTPSPTDSRSGTGSSGSGAALAPTGGTGGLIGILKGLEIEKSLATDPVVVALRYYPATTGSFAPLPPDLSPKLVEYLHGRGLDQLYTHQRAAYDLTKAGKSFVVTTPTASRKTLC